MAGHIHSWFCRGRKGQRHVVLIQDALFSFWQRRRRNLTLALQTRVFYLLYTNWYPSREKQIFAKIRTLTNAVRKGLLLFSFLIRSRSQISFCKGKWPALFNGTAVASPSTLRCSPAAVAIANIWVLRISLVTDTVKRWKQTWLSAH